MDKDFVPRYTPEEVAIARKYKRITGIEPVGLIDTLRIVTSPDMRDLFNQYLATLN